jgi:hypothetical protein
LGGSRRDEAEPDSVPRRSWPGPSSNDAEVRAGFTLVAAAVVLELLLFLTHPGDQVARASWAFDRCGDWRWTVWAFPLAVGATGLGLVLHGARNEEEEPQSFRTLLFASIFTVLALGVVLFFSFRPDCGAAVPPTG